MGNCIRHESPMEWGGEDWGSPEEERPLSGGLRPSDDVPAAAGITEVKVKISKKQLEQLLRKLDEEEERTAPAREVVARLLDAVGGRYEAHQRAWRPALQSIPEVN